jgi:hypothetical protein
MSAHQAKELFEKAIEYVNADDDPATWNMLSGLITLSQALQAVANDVQSVKREVDAMKTEVHRIKTSIR